ncbi:MAG: flagellar biosynthesis protein FlhF [Deltaproteobacteria bacterium]|nr:flagellar biosynthesis protein FlhF [Deltaproteobacteria bacterium]
MQIKRFEAQDMSEALKMIKREFGPQAVILSARDINKRKGVLGLLSSPGVEVTAATDTHNGNGKPKMENLVSRKWTLQKDPFNSATPKAPVGTTPSRPLKLGQKGRLKGSTRPKRETSHFQENDNLIRFLNLYEELQDQGVEEDLSSSLIENLRANTLSDEVLSDKEIMERLIDALKELGAADSATRVKYPNHRVVVLVGATGVGKTTTMAKMAVVETFQKGKEIALITLNDHRIGATAQMEAYGKILGVPMAAVSNRRELRACMKRFRDKDLILIDTPGISQNDIYGINELKDLLEAVDYLEIHLLVCAGTKEKYFENIFN